MFNHIKKFFRETFRNSRAMTRLTAAITLALPAVVGLVALQATVIGPLFRNRTFVTKLVSKMACALLGLKVVFNKKSAPLGKGKPTVNMYNHLSFLDPIVVGSAVDGLFVGKGELLKNKLLAGLLNLVGFIGVRRKREFNPQSNGKIIEQLNRGESINYYPQGTVVPKPEVTQFHAGLLEPFYGGEAINKRGEPIALKRDVATQAFALNVVRVGKHRRGAKTTDNNKLFAAYGDPAPGKGMWSKIWECMKINQTIEITAFPVKEPEAYDNARDLANQAALDVASIINPLQAEAIRQNKATFPKAKIPFSPSP